MLGAPRYSHNFENTNLFPRSLIKSIKAGRGRLAEGDELGTVGVSVSDYTLNGETTAKFHDLAGQVHYYGLHQIVMTSRAVYVLTWDVSKYLRQTQAITGTILKCVIVRCP